MIRNMKRENFVNAGKDAFGRVGKDKADVDEDACALYLRHIRLDNLILDLLSRPFPMYTR